MSTKRIEYLYLNDVTFTDEAEGRFSKGRPGTKLEEHYSFNVLVSPDDYKITEKAINNLKGTMGGEDEFIFTPDPDCGYSEDHQLWNAYVARYGREKTAALAREDGTFKTYRPMDCVLSSPEVRRIYFRQLDIPKVTGADQYANLIDRKATLVFHLVEYLSGQIHAACDYINLHPNENDPLADYVPSGKDDGGLF